MIKNLYNTQLIQLAIIKIILKALNLQFINNKHKNAFIKKFLKLKVKKFGIKPKKFVILHLLQKL